MRVALSSLIQQFDALELPSPGASILPEYKEWYHFNILDSVQGLYAIVNMAVGGDIYNDRQGAAFVVLAAYQRERGWTGNIDWYPASQVANGDGVGLSIGQHRLSYHHRRFQVQAALQDGSLGLDLALTPRAMLIPLRNDIPFGMGRIDWIILPRLSAEGNIKLDGVTYPLGQAVAYHDHNRGYWRWGEGVGWDWGFAIQPFDASRDGSHDAAFTVVFDRATDPHRLNSGDHTLLVWRGPRFLKLFLGTEVTCTYRGDFGEGLVLRIPHVMDLLAPAQISDIPGEVLVRARDGADHVELALHVESVLQILVPKEGGSGNTSINELLGTCDVSGRVARERFSFSCQTFAEYVA